jgi:hypothetical protein
MMSRLTPDTLEVQEENSLGVRNDNAVRIGREQADRALHTGEVQGSIPSAPTMESPIKSGLFCIFPQYLFGSYRQNNTETRHLDPGNIRGLCSRPVSVFSSTMSPEPAQAATMTTPTEPPVPPEYLAVLQLSDGLAFLNASRKLDFDDFSPKHFLLCHAIELGGKAFLLAKNQSPKKGHDMLQLFDQCAANGLQLDHPLARHIIETVAPVHLDHRLRYARPGTTQLPNYQDMESFCEELFHKAWEAQKAAALLESMKNECAADS